MFKVGLKFWRTVGQLVAQEDRLKSWRYLMTADECWQQIGECWLLVGCRRRVEAGNGRQRLNIGTLFYTLEAGQRAGCQNILACGQER